MAGRKNDTARAGNGAWLVLSVLVAFFLTAGFGFAEEKKVRVVCDPWTPWMKGESMQAPTGGIFVEVVEELFRRAKIPNAITVYPFGRCMHMMRKGESEVILMVSKNAEREKFMAFSEPVVRSAYVAYFNREKMPDFSWEKWEDLRSLRIGTAEGFYYGEGFKVAVSKYKIQVESVPMDGLNIKKLLAGRLDLILLDRMHAETLLASNPLYREKLQMAEKVICETPYHIAISKESPAHAQLDTLNQFIREMQEDGTIEKVMQKYAKAVR